MHFLLAAGMMRLVKDLLFLRFRHGGIGIERVGVHGQCHTEAQGHFVKIHLRSSFMLLHPACFR